MDKYREKSTITKGEGLKKKTAMMFFAFLLSFAFIELTLPTRALIAAKVTPSLLTIQQAIDASAPGGTVLVLAGTYHENITVWKPLTIKGESRDTTIIDQVGALAVCRITSDSVFLSGFTMRGGSIGVWIDGSVQNTTVDSNAITNNDDGVWVTSSNDSLISNNIITENLFMGIYINNSNATRSIGNTINFNTYGIYAENSENSSIFDNIVSQNYADGFHATSSNHNTLFHNMINNNTCGIYLQSSSNNLIYGNNVMHNDNQAWADSATTNSWDNGYLLGGNHWSDYDGPDYFFGPYQNLTGGDGIGDTPYTFDSNNVDHYPLTSPFEYWSDPILGDVNKDMKVDLSDIVLLLDGFGSVNGSDGYYWHAPPCIFCPHSFNLDIDQDTRIALNDITITLDHFGQQSP